MLDIKEILKISPIIPVCVIEDAKDALSLAKALQKGGINICEITLRTDAALSAIKEISQNLPDMIVGVGSVKNMHDYEKALQAGSKFVVSPGLVENMIKQAKRDKIPILPGVMTPSEILKGLELELEHFKLFPANIAGGVDFLKAIKAPISEAKFCPTGGVSLENIKEFLTCKNVVCVGGSWLAPLNLIKKKDFEQITSIAHNSLQCINDF